MDETRVLGSVTRPFVGDGVRSVLFAGRCGWMNAQQMGATMGGGAGAGGAAAEIERSRRETPTRNRTLTLTRTLSLTLTLTRSLALTLALLILSRSLARLKRENAMLKQHMSNKGEL